MPFYELAPAGPAPIASEMLRRIAELYRIEHDIRGRSADQRRAVRHEKSRPIVAELEPWMKLAGKNLHPTFRSPACRIRTAASC